MNSTYKSTLKGLKTLEFGLKAGLLSSAKWSKQRACRGRLGGGAAWSARHQNKRQLDLLSVSITSNVTVI